MKSKDSSSKLTKDSSSTATKKKDIERKASMNFIRRESMKEKLHDINAVEQRENVKLSRNESQNRIQLLYSRKESLKSIKMSTKNDMKKDERKNDDDDFDVNIDTLNDEELLRASSFPRFVAPIDSNLISPTIVMLQNYISYARDVLSSEHFPRKEIESMSFTIHALYDILPPAEQDKVFLGKLSS
jgi:hypothetical protein